MKKDLILSAIVAIIVSVIGIVIYHFNYTQEALENKILKQDKYEVSLFQKELIVPIEVKSDWMPEIGAKSEDNHITTIYGNDLVVDIDFTDRLVFHFKVNENYNRKNGHIVTSFVFKKNRVITAFSDKTASKSV